MSEARKQLRRRLQAAGPSIDHLKADHRLRRNFLKGARGDAMNPILAAAGFYLRWLMRWIALFGADYGQRSWAYSTKPDWMNARRWFQQPPN